MFTIVFWNTNGRSLDSLVSSLARQHNADLVILAEYASKTYSTLDRLNEGAGFQFEPGGKMPKGMAAFCRFPPSLLIPRFDGHRVSIRTLTLPARQELNVAIAHLPSKLYETADDQLFEFTSLSAEISKVEAGRGHCRTVLMGDLNANPFEAGIVGAMGLNATMSRHIAQKGFRTVKGRKYPFFYNPMWNHFGDNDGPVCGTYYFDKSTHVNYYWNIFDQVLVRPDLLAFLPSNAVELVSEAESQSLLSQNGRPDQASASDHLPIVFRLDI